MLTTPFGRIRILADGEPVQCAAVPFVFDRPMTRQRPLAGCYRVRVDAKGHRELRCVLEGCAAAGAASSGEEYHAMEFTEGSRKLTIGTESDRAGRSVVPVPGGICVTLSGDGAPVVFGIAWAEDHQGDPDVRTWFAADPILD